MPSNALRRLAIAGVACALALNAGEVWNSKDYTQWSDDDINQILTNSPWAKKTNVTLDTQGVGQSRGDRDGTGSVRGRTGTMGTPGNSGGGEYGGNGGGVYGRKPDLTVVVRWDSALPVLLARRKSEANENTEKYAIGIVGLAKPHLRTPADPADDSEIRDQLIYATRLVRKGKEPLPPEDVQFDHENGVSVIRFIFPRTNDPISLDDKEVSFQTQVGPAKIEQKFKVKDMAFKNKLAL
jgi:hypothetical protein